MTGWTDTYVRETRPRFVRHDDFRDGSRTLRVQRGRRLSCLSRPSEVSHPCAVTSSLPFNTRARPHKIRKRNQFSLRAHEHVSTTPSVSVERQGVEQKMKVMIAGGGLGGLFLAISLIKKGFEVTVLERTENYRAFGGPIQLASNGTGTLKATSERLYTAVQRHSRPFWGTLSGIKDGFTGEWMFRFDAITRIPNERNLPFALCIDRSDLQTCLLGEIQLLNSDERYGHANILMGAALKSYRQDALTRKVSVELENGSSLEGDILVGADGIWSTVRAQMLCEPQHRRGSRSSASHTGFRLFSALPIHQCADFFDIGYCAYIGPENYFVTCPDRSGRMQWYAFIKSKPEAEQIENPKDFLLKTFQGWSSDVTALISVSEEQDISQRDLWDRPPCLKGWSDGNVVLLGDSCHATMPNIGQGCGLAFEDAFVLSHILDDLKDPYEAASALKVYCSQRLLRTAAIQGLGRMNSEAIKILTPLLPIKPVIDFVISPFLPLVFELQFGYCYSFCPSTESSNDSVRYADQMRKRHEAECISAWKGSA